MRILALRFAALPFVVVWLGVAPPVHAQAAQFADALGLRPDAPKASSTASTAQIAEPEKPTRSFFPALIHNLGDDIKHLPRRNSIYWVAGGGALSLAVHPEDGKINRRLRGSHTADVLFTPGKYVGGTTVQLGAALTTYVVGRARDQQRVRHLGMDLIEAQLLADGITQGIKVAVRRKRPLGPEGRRANGFSFPSGHAAATFASATVLQQHLGWKAAVPTFTIASYVAISRLHDNRHYLSDVIFGAANGIIVGRSVTWHGRNYYALTPIALPGGIGVLVAWK